MAKKESRKHQPSHKSYWVSKKNEGNKQKNIYKHLARSTAILSQGEFARFSSLGGFLHENLNYQNNVRLKGCGAVAVVRAIRLGVSIKDVLDAIGTNNWKRVYQLVGSPNRENLDYRPTSDVARKNLELHNLRQYKKMYG
jgi:hypothetical protein